ncbi:WD domain, G-beta repeat protein [Trichuris suis]|nr:WD domain, G-beta repeat protein [Trichuris suis]
MTYRDIVYEQLRTRNRNIDAAYEEIMDSYAELLDCVLYMRSHLKRADVADKPTCSGSDAEREKERLVEAQLLELQQERAELYKRKGETAEAMLELNKKFENMERERSELLKQLELARSKLAALENDNQRLKESLEELDRLNQCLKDENFVLQSTSNVLEQNNRQLTVENAQLLERWKSLNQREADLLNLQNDLQIEYSFFIFCPYMAPKLLSLWQNTKSEGTKAAGRCSQTFFGLGNCARNLRQNDNANLYLLQEAHDSEVLALAWAHDRDLLATGGADRRLKLWEICDGRQSRAESLTGCNQAITCIDMSIDDTLVLAGSNDFAIRIWGVSDNRLRHTLTGHSGKVLCAKFTSQQDMVVSGSNDRTLKIWNLRQRACSKTLFPASSCNDITLVGGSAVTIISGHFDKKLRFWDYRCDTVIKEVEMPARITSLDLSFDEQSLLCAVRDDSLHCVDLRQNRIVRTYADENFKIGYDFAKARFSPDDRYCVCGSADGSVYFWDVQSGRLVQTLSNTQRNGRMIGRYHTETAVQLFSRFGNKPSLNIHLGGLLDEALAPKQILEINGETVSGRSLLLLDLIASCIMNTEEGGLAKGVLFIDCARHFSLEALAITIDCRLNDHDEIKLKTVLSRLHYICCNDANDLMHSFDLIDDILQRTPNLFSLLIVDDVSYYWWENVADIYSCQRRLARRFSQAITEHSLVGVFTRHLVPRRPIYGEQTGRICTLFDSSWSFVQRKRLHVQRLQLNCFSCTCENRIVYFRTSDRGVVYHNEA